MAINSKKKRQQRFSADFQLIHQRPSYVRGWLRYYLLYDCALFNLQNGEARRQTCTGSFPTECSCPAQCGDSVAKRAAAAGVKVLSLYDVVFLIYKKPEVQFMHGSNHTEHYTK
jgi:hypothetical protein